MVAHIVPLWALEKGTTSRQIDDLKCPFWVANEKEALLLSQGTWLGEWSPGGLQLYLALCWLGALVGVDMALCDSLCDRHHFSRVHCVPGTVLKAIRASFFPALNTICPGNHRMPQEPPSPCYGEGSWGLLEATWPCALGLNPAS